MQKDQLPAVNVVAQYAATKVQKQQPKHLQPKLPQLRKQLNNLQLQYTGRQNF